MRPGDRSTGSVRHGVGAVALLLLAGCGEPDLLDPTEGEVAADRRAVVDVLLEGAEAVADYFSAGQSLGARTDTRCDAGTDNWKVHDTYRSVCSLDVSTAFPLDAEPWSDLPGLAAHMEAHGWGGVEWDIDLSGGGFDDLEELLLAGYELTDVAWITFVYYGDETGGVADSVRLGLHVEAASSPAQVADPPAGPAHGDAEPTGSRAVGNYFASTEGRNWQDAWSEQRSEHVSVLVAGGYCEFAEQSW